MAKGLDKHRERQTALSLLGKDLARRCGRKCELCDTGGAGFSIFEVEPVPREPELDCCLLVCNACHERLVNKGPPDHQYWRCLESSAWKELPAIQVTSVRLLRCMENTDWAQQLLETLYLTPDAEAWLEASG